MLDNEKRLNFVELQDEEMYEINGGFPWVPVLIGAGCIVVFGIGVYNGYKDTKDQKK